MTDDCVSADNPNSVSDEPGANELVAVINGDRQVVATEGSTLVIGRADRQSPTVIGLDPHDRGISRTTCSIESFDGWWTVVNRSAKTPLGVLPFGSPEPLQLAPGARYLINQSPCIVHIRGLVRSHRVDLLIPPAGLVAASVGDGAETDVFDVVLSEGERDALVALFSGYVRPFPRRDPRPVSYEEAGRLLDLPASTVRRRIERLRERLAEAGWFIEGTHARFDLADLALERGWVTPDDLSRLTDPT